MVEEELRHRREEAMEDEESINRNMKVEEEEAPPASAQEYSENAL